MKYFNHGIIIAVIAAVFFYVCTWTFNHVNPWLSYALGIVGGVILINYIYKQIKTNQK